MASGLVQAPIRTTLNHFRNEYSVRLSLSNQPMDTLVAPELAQAEVVAQMERAIPPSTAAATPIPIATAAEDGAIAMENTSWEAAVPAVREEDVNLNVICQ